MDRRDFLKGMLGGAITAIVPLPSVALDLENEFTKSCIGGFGHTYGTVYDLYDWRVLNTVWDVHVPGTKYELYPFDIIA